jgi:hypothetical protein
LIWVAGTAVFAFMPLLFLLLINTMSGENMSVMEIDHISEAKVIVFICCAVMGAVVFNFIMSPFKVKGWLSIFAIYISPVCFLAYLFLKYLLLYVQFAEQHDFGPGLLTTRFTILFTIAYSILVKTVLNIKHHHARLHNDI